MMMMMMMMIIIIIVVIIIIIIHKLAWQRGQCNVCFHLQSIVWLFGQALYATEVLYYFQLELFGALSSWFALCQWWA